jgi:hypothetical protein
MEKDCNNFEYNKDNPDSSSNSSLSINSFLEDDSASSDSKSFTNENIS